MARSGRSRLPVDLREKCVEVTTDGDPAAFGPDSGVEPDVLVLRHGRPPRCPSEPQWLVLATYPARARRTPLFGGAVYREIAGDRGCLALASEHRVPHRARHRRPARHRLDHPPRRPGQGPRDLRRVDARWIGSLRMRSNSSSSTGFSPSMPVSVVQNATWPVRPWVDKPEMLVVRLIRERGCDLVNVEQVEVEHQLRVGPQPAILGAAGSRS